MRLLLLLLLFSPVCFGQTAQQPAEVPVENEPHHHLVFENEYVRVFKVEVAPHEATLVHRHKRDYVVVTIGDAEVTNAVVGKEPKKWKFKDGDVTFLEASGEKSFAHKAVNEGDKPFRNFTVEIKTIGDRLMSCEHDASSQSCRTNASTYRVSSSKELVAEVDADVFCASDPVVLFLISRLEADGSHTPLLKASPQECPIDVIGHSEAEYNRMPKIYRYARLELTPRPWTEGSKLEEKPNVPPHWLKKRKGK